MKITVEQIEAESETLRVDAKQMMACARTIFAVLSRVQLQIQRFDRIRDPRSESFSDSDRASLIIIGFVTRDQDEPHPLCALMWTSELVSPRDIRLFLKADWDAIMPADVAAYFGLLLEDWKALMQISPETILVFASELSVGPLRTIETVTIQTTEASAIVQQKLGTVLRFPS